MHANRSVTHIADKLSTTTVVSRTSLDVTADAVANQEWIHAVRAMIAKTKNASEEPVVVLLSGKKNDYPTLR